MDFCTPFVPAMRNDFAQSLFIAFVALPQDINSRHLTLRFIKPVKAQAAPGGKPEAAENRLLHFAYA
jgi:hypothetical protein